MWGNMKNVIEIENLKKSFGEVKAVDGISFSVKEGELFAFLGVNGAGKSTTINIICSQLEKDSGKVIIDGKSIDEDSLSTKRKLGVVFQSSVLDSSLTVYDNLESRAALYGIVGEDFKKKFSELSTLLDLDEIKGRRLGKLSGGQKRRIDIARALIHEPKILILDEPTTGLDPKTRKTIWQVIEKWRKEKSMTVFLTTHYMEEAAEADYVVILDSGRIAAKGTPLELKNSYTGDYVTIYGANEDELVGIGISEFERIRDALRFSVSSTAEATSLICKHPDLFCDYEITKGKMDDVFLAATGKSLSQE